MVTIDREVFVWLKVRGYHFRMDFAEGLAPLVEMVCK